MRIVIIFFASFLALTSVSCKRRGPSGNENATKSFAPNADAHNVALLMNAFGYTPNSKPEYDQELNEMYEVLKDPKGNFNFDPKVFRDVTEADMKKNIENAAAEVGDGGTFFLFIAAHGANVGKVLPNTIVGYNNFNQPIYSNIATIGYPEIIAAIKAGRSGKQKMRRFVLYISACYSGSWRAYIQDQAKEFAVDQVSFTSTSADTQNYINISAKEFLSTFRSFSLQQNPTIRQFWSEFKKKQPRADYLVTNESIFDEPLFNPLNVDPNADNDHDGVINSQDQCGYSLDPKYNSQILAKHLAVDAAGCNVLQSSHQVTTAAGFSEYLMGKGQKSILIVTKANCGESCRLMRTRIADYAQRYQKFLFSFIEENDLEKIYGSARAAEASPFYKEIKKASEMAIFVFSDLVEPDRSSKRVTTTFTENDKGNWETTLAHIVEGR